MKRGVKKIHMKRGVKKVRRGFPKVLYKKDLLKNLAIFTGKHLY